MLQLIEKQNGTIKFRGKNMEEFDVTQLRKLFGVVFQDFSRFKMTLYENISLAGIQSTSPLNEQEAVLKAGKKTGVDLLAQNYPEGYNTLLGKDFYDGTDLSVGQWQKVALARAFLRNSEVVFLDEPTAALDTKTEQEVFEQFLSLAEDKTAILISHRFSVTPFVDRILTLENGKLIEDGTHAELMTLNGKYAKMYKTQANMYLADAP